MTPTSPSSLAMRAMAPTSPSSLASFNSRQDMPFVDLTQQRLNQSPTSRGSSNSKAYDMLLVTYEGQQKQLRVTLMVNQELEARLKAVQDEKICSLHHAIEESEMYCETLALKDKELQGLQAKLDDTADIDVLKMERDIAVDTVSILKKERDSTVDVLNALMKERGSTVAEVDVLKKKRDSAMELVDALKNERDCAMEEVDTLKKQKERDSYALKKERDSAADEVEELKKERDKLLATKAMCIGFLNQKSEVDQDCIVKLQLDIDKAETLAKERTSAIDDKSNTMVDHQTEATKHQAEIDKWKSQIGKDEHKVESLEIKSNMQRQQLDEQTDRIRTLETKLEAKGLSLPDFLVRCNEADKLWAQIEVRDRTFISREATLKLTQEENDFLKAELAQLRDELNQTVVHMNEIKVNLDGDKVHMPWLLSQLRETLALREKVAMRDEIIKGQGYTVRAAQAEKQFQQKQKELNGEMNKLKSMMTMLSPVGDESTGRLLGKLEECLRFFPEVSMYDKPGDIFSFSYDSLSLNTRPSEEEWVNAKCITIRDCKEFMSPDDYNVVAPLLKEGICSGNNVEDKDVVGPDDRTEFNDDESEVHDETEANGDANLSLSNSLAQESEPVDVHLQMVESILQKDEKNVSKSVFGEDWRDWISPPTSPCRGIGSAVHSE